LSEYDVLEGLSDWLVVSYNLLLDASVAKVKSQWKFSMVYCLTLEMEVLCSTESLGSLRIYRALQSRRLLSSFCNETGPHIM
jgi:hypothetical protein